MLSWQSRGPLLALCECWQALISPSVQKECSQESSEFPVVANPHLIVLYASLCPGHGSHTAYSSGQS